MKDAGPILIHCDGSGCAGHDFGSQVMCSLCGQMLTPTESGKVPGHQRDDIIARINRGDFG